MPKINRLPKSIYELIAAGEVSHDLVCGRSLDVELFDILLRRAAGFSLVVESVGQELFDGHHGNVVVDRAAEIQSRDLSVLGDKRNTLFDDVLRRGDLHPLAVDKNLSL